METTWEQRRAQEQAGRQALLTRITSILNGLGWAVIPEEGDYMYPRIKAQNGKTGLTYFFQHDGRKLQVSAWFDVKTECGEVVTSDGTPSINVNTSRPLEAICRDIQRRLVPEAEAHLGLLLHRKEQYDESNQVRIANLEAALNRPLTAEERKSQTVSRRGIEISGATDGVTVRIRYLSGPAAVAVARALVESGDI